MNCHENNESMYKSCWQCESLKDGRPKPEPQTQTAPQHPHQPQEQTQTIQAELKQAIKTRFICGKCRQRGAEVKELSERVGLISASCMRCSQTELYNLEILSRQGESALSLLFGPQNS
jgi:predicted nucleic-acid-binding Zn-ribbon protein